MTVSRRRISSLAVVMLTICVMSGGCIGGLAQLLYVIKGHQVPAAYPGLKNQRVAVIAVNQESSQGPDALAATIEKFVSVNLAKGVRDIEIVPIREIENWKDNHRWDRTDYVELGRGVRADSILLIETSGYSLREGRTIYKGQATVAATVIDVESGQDLFSYGPQQFVYPQNGIPITQTDERQFEAMYLAWLTNKISRQFHKHDPLTDVADDAATLSLSR